MSTWMGWGSEPAARWRSAVLPRWVPWAATVLGIAGIAASVLGQPSPACLPAAPCHLVDTAGVAYGLILTSVLGWWRWPAAGALAGMLGALIDVVRDPSTAGRVGCFVFGFGCVAGLLWLRELVATQREAAEDASVRVPLPQPAVVVGFQRPGADAKERLVALGVLVVLLLTGTAWAHGVLSDVVHRSRAVTVAGTVVSGRDESLAQWVELTQLGLPALVSVTFSDAPPIGRAVTVSVDPDDVSWVEVPWDPHRHSWWLLPALPALGFLVWRARRWGRRRRGIPVANLPLVPVDWVAMGDGRVGLRPLGETGLWASYAVGPVPQGLVSSPADDAGYRRGVAVGDLRAGGWVQVHAAEATFRPRGPLQREANAAAAIHRIPRPGRHAAVQASPARAARSKGRPIWLTAKCLFGALLCVGVFVGFASDVPDAFVVANGGGVVGTATVTDKSCSKSCSYTVNYDSSDGRYHFLDVDFSGSGEVGDRRPARYVGTGEEPSKIYAPGVKPFLMDLLIMLGAVVGLTAAGVTLDRSWRRP